MDKRFRLLFFFLLVAVVSYASPDQEKDPVARKKVGLVLSGGGAKGVAHIGVLKVLERAGIPIDYIAGTSMGSIIGGLYAIGYNAQSLDSLVHQIDWSYVISDREDLRNQNLNDLEKHFTYMYSTKALGRGDRNTGGFIKGNNVAELFQRLCIGYSDSLDFSRDLPIPFACVSTNIMDNSEVVFHNGRLPQAMRASMSIPGAFSPVRIGDKVLVDGCLRNNYPADVARQMGADVLIGITLSGKPKKAEEISSTVNVLAQIVDNVSNNKYDENKAITDLYMNVDPRKFTPVSFSAAAIDSLVRYGEEEALKHWDDIMALKRRIGLPADYKPTLLHPLKPHILTDRQRVTAFSFRNMTPQAERFLKKKFHLERVDSIDIELERQLTSSMRVDLFYSSAECHLEPQEEGVHVILIAGKKKVPQLHAGIRFDTEEYVALQLGLEIPLNTAMPMNTEITMRLGKRIMGRAAITFHPSSISCPMFSCSFYRNDMDIYIKGDRDYTTLFNQIQAEFTPVNFNWRHFNIQLAVRWDHMHYRNQLTASHLKDVKLKNEHFFSYRAKVNYNSEDDWYFPTRGARFAAEYVYLTDNFADLYHAPGLSEVKAHWRKSFAIGDQFTLQPMLYGRMLFGGTIPIIFGNTIGGSWFGHYIEQQMPFAGVGHMEYVDQHFVAGQLQAQQHLGKNSYVVLTVAAAQQAERVNDLLKNSTMLGGQLAYYYKTMFGPLGASLGYSNHTKEPYFFVNLGYVF